MKKSCIVEHSSIEAAIKAVRIWQEQVNNSSLGPEVNEKSIESLIDWGIAQGYLNCLKQLNIITKEDYEFLSKKQQIIGNKVIKIQEKGLNNS